MRRTIYPPEVERFIMDNYRLTSTADLASKVNAEFGTNYTTSQMSNFKYRRRLKSGFRGGESTKGKPNSGRFKKGIRPWNTGLKGFCPKGSEKGWFKKGLRPHNWRPVGSERVVLGYVEVKTAEPNVWTAKNRLVWENVNGPIPAGHTVMFLDGDRRNFNPENLVLVSRSESAIVNRHVKLSRSTDINRVKITLARLMLARTRRKKGGKKQDAKSTEAKLS